MNSLSIRAKLHTQLTDFLTDVSEKVSLVDLRQAYAHLSEVYHRVPAGQDHVLNALQTQAYLAARMPATYAACVEALSALSLYDLKPRTLLDVGAGPGTASIACCTLFDSLEHLTLIDRNSFFHDIATSILHDTLPFTYALEDVKKLSVFPKADCVISSYAFNEWTLQERLRILIQAWEATEMVCVLIEPGTPAGFKWIKEARDLLIQKGGFILAPCTHEASCPIQEGDWCHFSAHVNRQAAHRHIKGALGHEYEKYSYLVVSRTSSKNALSPRPLARIVRPPLKRSGHVILDQCTATGLTRTTISKKDKALYAQARALEWGDAFEPL